MAVNLAVFRVFLFSTLLLESILRADLVWFASVPEQLQIGPTFFAPSFLLARTPALLLQLAFWASCTATILGYRARLLAPLTVLLGLFVLGIPHSFDKPGHMMNHNHHLIWFAAILALSPAWDLLSVDCYLATRRGEPIPVRSTTDFTRPLAAIVIIFGLIYFFPGFWKLRRCGLEWALSDNLRNIIYYRWFELGGFSPWFRIDKIPFLYQLLALWTLIFEVTFIFMVFHPRLRAIAAAQGLLFHIGTFLTMNLSFYTLVLCYAAFVNWERLFSRLGIRPGLLGDNSKQALIDTKRSVESTAQITISILIVVTVCVCGFGYRDSWPFGLYPRFDHLFKTEIAVIDIEAYTSTDEKIELNIDHVKDKFTAPRLMATVRYVHHHIGEPDGKRLAIALAELLHPLKGQDLSPLCLKFFDRTYPTTPQLVAAAPLSETFLFSTGCSPMTSDNDVVQGNHME